MNDIADGKKRRLSTEDAALDTVSDDHTSKKARKETNASARRSLFVRSLPATATTSALTELFSDSYPLKHATVVLDPVTKQSKGYGFVTFADAEDAQRALDEFNGHTFQGRKMKIEIAQPRSREAGGKDELKVKKKSAIATEAAEVKKARQEKLAEQKAPPKLIIRNLPWSIKTPDQLAKLFMGFGKVKHATLPKVKGKEAGFGFIVMRGRKNAEKALAAVNGREVDGRPLAVDWAVEKDVWEKKKTEDVDEDMGGTDAEQTNQEPNDKEEEDNATDRPKGTGFVCFFNVEDAESCFRNAPAYQPTGANATKKGDSATPQLKHSLLEPENADSSGKYTIDGRLLQISKAVEKDQATKLAEEGTHFRDNRDKDKRKLYLLSEGTVAKNTPLYDSLSPAEVKMREDSAMQRKKLIQGNPTLHLSLTRLAIRNLPRSVDSKALKALAREGVVGFAKDVKSGLRQPLSKEEEARGGEEMREAEKQRKKKGKGIVKQAKVVFEGREGSKIAEETGAGRSRGYGFVEYSSHRWALMGLRWLNGHALENSTGRKQRLIVEFAIENAQVVSRRKEREEKARTRSKEVTEKLESGEIVKPAKKVLGREQQMKQMRKGGKGMKGAGKGGAKEKSFERVVIKGKRKAEDDAPAESQRKKAKKTNDEAGEADEGGKQSQRARIIQKKRMLRRNRKKGGA
ncbi:nucleolar 4 protein [Rutstroemia sp. NJR-2017a WRK4]|nr:nucleolar 4 protein [Rutstroemia sp. NJR-2017a WRK4]PQE11859.1 nucleolar 4 protein [Rutstroemia sp. NJR-2017a WRK4]